MISNFLPSFQELRNTSFDRFFKLLKEGKNSIHLFGLKGSFFSFLSTICSTRYKRTTLIITYNINQAKEIWEEINFYNEKFILKENRIPTFFFPPWENLPFENISSQPDITSQRIEALYTLEKKNIFLVTCIQAILPLVIPPNILKKYTKLLTLGAIVPREEFLNELLEFGYVNVPLVEGKGEYSVRGGILDIFPPLYDLPLRFEFFGDEVTKIREFDPESQRSLRLKDKISILPVKEIILDEDNIKKAKKRIEKNILENNYSLQKKEEILEALEQKVFFQGIENYLPFFYERQASFFEYLPENTLIFVDNKIDVEQEAKKYYSEVEEIFYKSKDPYPHLKESFKLMPFVKEDNLPFQVVYHDEFRSNYEENEIQLDTTSNRVISDTIKLKKGEGSFLWLSKKLSLLKEELGRVLIVVRTKSQALRLLQILEEYGLKVDFFFENKKDEIKVKNYLGIIIGYISKGFCSYDIGFALLTEEEIFGEKKQKHISSRPKHKFFVSNFEDLQLNDLIVHVDYGIGVYYGLIHMKVGTISNDFLILEYQGGDKLYLPVNRLNLVQKYIGPDNIRSKLDRLGGKNWKKTKKRVKRALEEMVREIIEVSAERKISAGFAFSPPDNYFREFETLFDYEETSDQLNSIYETINDMQAKEPMDRIICGDVGYGKTEVAIRASFKAVMDGKQVAILVPTTVLAQQHFQTFSNRFDGYPVFISMLSRFKNKKEQKDIVNKLASGNVDIVIGTHRLLQKDIGFKDLGLLIVDEEHRFGVSHKEKFKKLKKTVDVLTLTATPIPRTLQMSLTGIRDLSIINTPPRDRLSIRTYVNKFDKNIIRSAILRELNRGGQVFFVHNNIFSIYAMERFLKKLVPEARISIGHGQMQEDKLEEVMLSFLLKRFDVLLCTTIIESGLDYPTANTILINRADMLGLAQMYQLRGRVGRSDRQAYAYFLIPGEGSLSKDARRRLKAISELSDLGSGFRLASYDLEIRGSGNLFGTAQSGSIAAVGFDLYNKLLEETIRKLKGKKIPEEIDPEINISVPAFFSVNFISDTNQRLFWYKRISSIKSMEEIPEIEEELCDRYGNLPDEAKEVLNIVELKMILRDNMVTSFNYDGKNIIFGFHKEAFNMKEKILKIISDYKEECRFTPKSQLKFKYPNKDWDKIRKKVFTILK
jgi:transcription-repair coupling factor (superfamily II helicase)